MLVREPARLALADRKIHSNVSALESFTVWRLSKVKISPLWSRTLCRGHLKSIKIDLMKEKATIK